jgi:predicted O-methyltransferase YrrM
MTEFKELSFCPELVEMLRSRRAVGRAGKVYDGLPAVSTLNNLICLRRMMLEIKPSKTMEVGLSFGGSCLVFTCSHRDLGRPPAGQHVALDPFESSVWQDCGVMAAERAGVRAYLDFRPVFSSLELPKLVSDGARCDLIYIDGSHLFEDVFVDAYFAVRLLSDGGVVIFDDSSTPQVAKVLRFLRKNLNTSLAELDLSPYRISGRGRLAYRLARLAGRNQMTAFRRNCDVEREWNAPFCSF